MAEKAFEVAFKHGEQRFVAFGMDESAMRVYDRSGGGLGFGGGTMTFPGCTKFMPEAEFDDGFASVSRERTPREIIERYGWQSAALTLRTTNG